MKNPISILLILFGIFLTSEIKAQSLGYIKYSDTFTAYSVYCPGSSQYDGWGTFRAKLDTTIFKIMQVNMRGTYTSTGRTCNDSFIARKIAISLKNATAYTSPACNGNVWVVSAPGSCSAGGCIVTADNVGLGADGQANACYCVNPSYQIRPIIGNLNWGGVNSTSCSPSPTQRMIVEFGYKMYPNDVSVSSVNPANLCDNPNTITAKIKNTGSNTIDSVRVSWSLNGALQNTTYFNKKILSAKDTVIILKTGFNYTPYTNYIMKVWTWKPNGRNDAYTPNDTFIYVFRYSGTPKIPDLRDTSLCGSGISTLIGNPAGKNDSIIWYGSKTGNTILGVGKFFKTTWLSPGKYKYFGGSAGQLINTSIQSDFNGINQQAGFMMDVKASQSTNIDSVAINIGAPSGVSADIEFYYRDSTFGPFQSNPSAWNLVGRYKVISRGVGKPTPVPAKFSIPAGKRYGIYIQTSNAPSFYLKYGNGNNTYTDGTLTINPPTLDDNGRTIYGIGLELNWGSVYASRIGNIKFYYRIPQCVSPRDSMTLIVKRRPSGALILKGTPFDSPNPATAGTIANPDITGVGMELNYELQPPTGYSNSGFGTTWAVTDLRVMKPAGNTVSNTDTMLVMPSATSNGKLKFIADATLEDSIITISATLKDLTSTQCDSTLLRKIYIAPTPKTNFTFNTVCFGTPTEFKNLSTIRRGNISYKWDFGNGDSSFLSDPVYLYPSHGFYNVKLTSTSDYGIIKDTIINVAVNEMPDVKYKVFNACSGDSLSFVNSTSINSGKISYKWDFGDGKSSSDISPKHKYVIEASYIVTLTANANGCSNSLSKKAHQFVKPIADFSFNGYCSKNMVTFKNLTTIGLSERFGSSWQFGDGENTNDANPVHIYYTPGIKIVKFIATSQFGCKDSSIKTLNILASPEASFTHGAVCNIKPVIFDNTTIEPSGVSTGYIWAFGDGSISNLKNPEHYYAELGKKTIRLTALGNNGCTTYFEKDVNVLPQPVADFKALDACMGNNVIFTNKTIGSGQLKFKWKFGDGDSSEIFSPVKNYKVNVASTFNVTLIAFNIGGCSDLITRPVNITESPKCGFTYKSTGTGGYEYIFTPHVLTYPFYQWSFEGGGYSNLPVVTHKFSGDGKFRVRIFIKNAEDCDCIDSNTFVTVNHVDVKEIKNNKTFYCFPNPNKGSFSVKISEISPSESFILNIYDITGRSLYQFNLTGSKNHELNCSDLLNGVYTVEIMKKSGERITGKMSVIK